MNIHSPEALIASRQTDLYQSYCSNNTSGFCKSPRIETILPPSEASWVTSFITPEKEIEDVFACNATRNPRTHAERRLIERRCTGYCAKLSDRIANLVKIR